LPKEIKESISSELEKKFEFLFQKLNVVNTKDAVKKYIKPVKVELKFSEDISKKTEEHFEGAD